MCLWTLLEVLTIDGADVKSKKSQLLTPDGDHYLINRLMNMHDHTDYFTNINEVALKKEETSKLRGNFSDNEATNQNNHL